MNNILKTMAAGIGCACTIASAMSFSCATSAASPKVTEGIYYIQTAVSSSKVLDIKDRATENLANCQIYERNNTAAQAFRIYPVESDSEYYILQYAVSDNMVLDVNGGEGYNGCNVTIYQYNGGDNQLWSFEDAGNGYYYIKSKTGYYLDVTDGKSSNYTNIQVYCKNKSNPSFQKFTLKENYSVSTATEYAQKYTDNSGSMKGTYNNKDYNIYHNEEFNGLSRYKGYDCANFGSQCLYSGGFAATDKWSPVGRGEDYRKNTAKTTWVAAKDLYNYLKSLGYPVKKVNKDLSNINKGDIVFITDGNGTAEHTTICTGYKNGTPVYCAHSAWRKNQPYSYEAFKNAYVIDLSFNSCKKIKTSNRTIKVTQNTYTIKSTSGAKVRSSAGKSYNQVGGLAKGSVVYYTETKNNDGFTWYHISSVEAKEGSWGSYTGWVANV